MEAQTSTEFILGPMFSGKTTRMLESIQKERMGGVDCLVVKHAKDSRYTSGAAIQTHNQRLFTTETGEEATAPGSQRIVMAEDLLSLEVASNEAVVGVDEGQFFGDLRAAILQWQNEGRRVIVSALDGDYGRQMFAPIIEALPLATAIVKLSAVCTECALRKKKRVDAPYTLRCVQSVEKTLIGGQGVYKAVCLGCYQAGHQAGLLGFAE